MVCLLWLFWMHYKCWWNCPRYCSTGPSYLPKNLTQVQANYLQCINRYNLYYQSIPRLNIQQDTILLLPKARLPSLRSRSLRSQGKPPSLCKYLLLALTWAFLKRKWTRMLYYDNLESTPVLCSASLYLVPSQSPYFKVRDINSDLPLWPPLPTSRPPGQYLYTFCSHFPNCSLQVCPYHSIPLSICSDVTFQAPL